MSHEYLPLAPQSDGICTLLSGMIVAVTVAAAVAFVFLL